MFLPSYVKYVLVGAYEKSPGTFRFLVWLHIAILPAVIAVAVGILAIAALKQRRDAPSRVTPAPASP